MIPQIDLNNYEPKDSHVPSLGFIPFKVPNVYGKLYYTTKNGLNSQVYPKSIFIRMSRWPDSNWRPTLYESVALPTELHRQRIQNCLQERVTRFGLAVFSLGRKRVTTTLHPLKMRLVYLKNRKMYIIRT